MDFRRQRCKVAKLVANGSASRVTVPQIRNWTARKREGRCATITVARERWLRWRRFWAFPALVLYQPDPVRWLEYNEAVLTFETMKSVEKSLSWQVVFRERMLATAVLCQLWLSRTVSDNTFRWCEGQVGDSGHNQVNFSSAVVQYCERNATI